MSLCNIQTEIYPTILIILIKPHSHTPSLPSDSLSNYLHSIGYKCDDSKSVGPDGVPGEILKLGGEAMAPYLARLLETSLNNAAIPSDWKKPQLFLFAKGVIDRQSQNIDQ
jgi:hypothetical protein